MLVKKIQRPSKQINGQSIDVKIVKIKKFLELKNKIKTIIIWKLWLHDFTGISVFFTDEKLNFDQQRNFKISDLKILFHRGKKKFIFKKIIPSVQNIKKKSIL